MEYGDGNISWENYIKFAEFMKLSSHVAGEKKP